MCCCFVSADSATSVTTTQRDLSLGTYLGAKKSAKPFKHIILLKRPEIYYSPNFTHKESMC